MKKSSTQEEVFISKNQERLVCSNSDKFEYNISIGVRFKNRYESHGSTTISKLKYEESDVKFKYLGKSNNKGRKKNKDKLIPVVMVSKTLISAPFNYINNYCKPFVSKRKRKKK